MKTFKTLLWFYYCSVNNRVCVCVCVTQLKLQKGPNDKVSYAC